MAKKKVVEFDLFKALEEQYKEKSRIVKINGIDVVIKVDETFKESKINTMVKNTMTYISEARDRNINISIDDLVIGMVVTSFSNIPVKVEGVEDLIAVVGGLVDLKDTDGKSVLAHIFDMVDEKEIERVNNMIKKFGENTDKLLEEQKFIEEKVVE